MPVWLLVCRETARAVTRFDKLDQFPRDVVEHTFPVAKLRLPEQPRCRIPRAIAAVAQPTPFGHKREHEPYRDAHGTSEVTERRIDRYNEVDRRHDRRGVEEVWLLAAEIDDATVAL